VEVEILKKKRSHAEGVVVRVLEVSKYRVEARDEAYLSTSPWQIMDFEYEMEQKRDLILEAFGQEGIELGFDLANGVSPQAGDSVQGANPNTIQMVTDGREWGYRNKMEYSFWWDKEGEKVDLAFYRRGTHGKMAVEGSSLAVPAIDEFARVVLAKINELGIEARDLKTLMVRCSMSGGVAGQLYVMREDFDSVGFAGLNLAIEVIYSDPRCPASVATKKLYGKRTELRDEILGREYSYAVDGFFQVNLPVYEMVLKDMAGFVGTGKVVDLYSGVGTIGLSIARDQELVLVEVSEAAVAEARKNAAGTGAEVVLAKSEDALDYIEGAETVIVDPPRAGLHTKVVEKLLEVCPEKIIYLSCNPTTQARDVKMLLERYEMEFMRGYNFFPKTPHIESLVVLKYKHEQ